MRKALFAAVCVAALGVSAPAFAQEAGNITNDGVINGFNDSSVNADVVIEDTANDNSDNSTNTTIDVNDTLNDNSDNSTNTTITVTDTGNDNSVTRTSTNNHTLSATVTNATVNFIAGVGEQSGDILTGDVVSDTSGSFAGIQNMAANTGVATNVLVSNAISANADISFGGAD